MQSISTPMQAVATSDVRVPRINIKASWLKVSNPSTVFAMVGTSLVGGPDLVQGSETVITNADLFAYMDESVYGMRFDYDRMIEEPRGGTSHAIADILLDNITRRFSPEINATIGTAIEARRPFKASIGLEVNGVDRFVQIIIGLTAERPQLSRSSKTMEVQVYDYITFLDNATIQAAIYENMRIDEIIASILTGLGFGSSQYVLDTGLNTIPFAWFDKDKNAGKRIRELCESEGATFYQDENGILRLENRNHTAVFPYTTAQHTIDPGDILLDQDDVSTRMINRAIVVSKPRKVDTLATDIWSSSQIIEIQPSATEVVWAAFYDDQSGNSSLPIKEITTPAANTDYTGNTASNGSGSDKTAQLAISVTNFVESAKIEITNNDAGVVYVTLLKLRGKAARVTQAIQAIAEDSTSINKYEAQEYKTENNMIQTNSLAQTLADSLVARYKNPLGRRIIRIPGLPHLQLRDLVNVINPNPYNLISNPSFEKGTDGWSTYSTGVDAPTITVSQARDVDVPDGVFVGKITIA